MNAASSLAVPGVCGQKWKVLESTYWAVRGLNGAAAAFSGLSGVAAECVQARVCNPKDLVHPRGHLRGEDPSVALAVGTHALRVWDSFSPPPVDSSV